MLNYLMKLSNKKAGSIFLNKQVKIGCGEEKCI